MIASIGYKRFLLIVILAAGTGIFAFASYFVFAPKVESTTSELSTLQAQSSTLQGEIDQMRDSFAQFDKKKVVFEDISRMGFFNDQNRVLARERFDTLQKLSKIISARYEIRAANVLSQDIPIETGFVVMESPISITLTALDDIDIYRFIYYLNYGFPGHVTINSLNIERNGEVTPEVLKDIGTGNPPSLITATMELEWRTMARKESIAPGNIRGDAGVEAAGDQQ